MRTRPVCYRGGQRSELHRVVVNTVSGQVSRQSLSHRCCEFPTILAERNGRPAKYVYTPAAAVEDPYHWGPNQVHSSTAVFEASTAGQVGLDLSLCPALNLFPTPTLCPCTRIRSYLSRA